MEVFPVSIVPVSREDAPTRSLSGGRTKRCLYDRLWFAQWHDQPRGRRPNGGRYKHHAQDIFGPPGSLILAPDAGVIVGSSRTEGPTPKGGHWLRLAVRNGRGQTVRTYYMAHLLEAPAVATGAEVQAGEAIALLGRTGNATRTCPHLHIGARRWRRGKAIDIFEELMAVDPTKRAPVTAPAIPTDSECQA